MTALNRRNQERLQHLAWFDILILTIIFWGEGIYNSTYAYLMLLKGSTSIEGNLMFSAADNYKALVNQAMFMLIGLVYLWLRRFDFKSWNIRLKPGAVILCLPLFLGGALLMDIWIMLSGLFAANLPFPGPVSAFFGTETVSSVIYALFNGVYEEMFFLGICLSVKPADKKWAVPISLLVRFSFHTYQGMLSAFGIGFLFGLYLYVIYTRSKEKNLIPFFFAHAIGDVIGLGVLGYIL